MSALPEWMRDHLPPQPTPQPAPEPPVGLAACACRGEGCTACDGDGAIYP